MITSKKRVIKKPCKDTYTRKMKLCKVSNRFVQYCDAIGMLEQSRNGYYYATLHNVYWATIVVDRPLIIQRTHQIARNGVSIATTNRIYSQSNWFYRYAIRWKVEKRRAFLSPFHVPLSVYRSLFLLELHYHLHSSHTWNYAFYIIVDEA